MRSNDDSPRPSTRPSLLTPAQQAEADRNRILTKLEGGKSAVPDTGKRGGRVAAWSAMAVAALLLLGAGAWLGQRDGGTTGGDAAEAEAASVSAPAKPVVTTAPEAAPAGANINEEAPPPRQSLSEMLGAGTPAEPSRASKAAPAASDILSRALETPAKSTPKPVHAPVKKPLAKPVRPATTPEQDNDVALLAALLSHTSRAQQVAAPKKVTEPKKTPASLQSQLQQCGKLKHQAAGQCVARVCAKRADNKQCKAAKIAAKGEK